MNNAELKKESIFIGLSALILILITLILSDGYSPVAGFWWSLTNEMSLFDIAIGCEEKLVWQQVQDCPDGIKLLVKTKYVLALLGLISIFGLGQFLGIFPSVRGKRQPSPTL
ncbi:hypothetical protein BK659_21315 [Pseudomonas brassicacearum]|uniref:Transmembrane protein n=1 Tax=Pseudomonas brassicacearum TaxID=930166 RepID=A0A423H1S4_9PSED|nr:hypothetical protein [Pseudomonas brassicacearum]RON05646.1 hypothetical protein BK659_21315 [Pseudomonas brassicacearum]